jgi:hypothetical protein
VCQRGLAGARIRRMESGEKIGTEVRQRAVDKSSTGKGMGTKKGIQVGSRLTKNDGKR